MALRLEIKVLHSVEELSKDSVDELADAPCFTYDWFSTLETQQAPKNSLLYLAVYDADRLVAFAPCIIGSAELSQFVAGPISRVLNKMGVKLRVLQCLAPQSTSSRVLLGKNLDEKVVLGLISDKIEEICKKQKIMFSYFPFVSQFDGLLLENLQTHSYIKRQSVTSFYLDAQWKSFQDYVGNLKLKAAKNVKREIKKCFENGITIEEVQDDNLATKLFELHSNLSLKYKVKDNVFDTDFFTKLKQHTGDAAHVFVAKKNNEVVGFCLTLRHKETLDVLTSGFNYDAQTKTDFTYFNLCYYSPIQWAINHGVRKIYFHGTADQAKLFRGCRPEKLYFFVKYHNRPVRVAMNKVFYPLYEGIVLSIFPEALKRKLNH